MSKEAQQRIAENKKSKDSFLDLSNCDLKTIPSELLECIWVKTLNLFNNRELSELSPLKDINQLEIIDISSTSVQDLSPIKHMVSLRGLNFSSTLVRDLSPLKNLSELKEIVFYKSQISDITALGDLKKIELIYAYYCGISDLSPLKHLYSLKKLHIFNTKVSDLSPLKNLHALEELDVSNTQVTNLQPILHLIRKEISIDISQCPINIPPPEIVKQGYDAISQYFAEIENQDVEQLYEAKLVLIGDGRSGKTTLRDKLKDANAPLPPEDAATKGVEIDIAKYQFVGDHGQPFKVNIWDFAGQEKYQAIHQFFYTHRALYILVENAREQKTDFDFWLQTAELCSGGSPVVIVHNEFGDQNRGLFNLAEYRVRYQKNWLKDDARVNFASNRGLADLERKIRFYIQELPHVGEKLPKFWANVRSQLLELSRHKPYLTLEAYFDLCRKAGIPEEERALYLSQYLHTLGAMLHYVDNDLLREIVILQNEWATDAAYRILDDDEITFETKGRFRRADLERIWTRPDYMRMRPQLLELMKKFKLCYQVRDMDLFIAPQLLPATPPEGYVWKPDEDLRLTLQYEFMPKGLLTRFTVNRHADIADGQMLAWNNGVVLEWKNTRAELTEQYRVNKGTIEIRVQGTDRKGLMSIVDKTFDELHDEFKGIKVEKMVPCNCPMCQISSNPNFYELSDLMRRKENNQRTVECKVSYENVHVIRLIENIFRNESPAVLLMAEGKILDALEVLLLTYPEAYILKARLNAAQNKFTSGIIGFKDFEQVQNQVIEGVQNLLRNE